MVIKLLPRDKRIIATIQHRADTRLTNFAKELGFKYSTFRYYLTVLENEGVIQGIIPVVNASLLGLQSSIVTYELCDRHDESLMEVYQFLEASPYVRWVGISKEHRQVFFKILAKNPRMLRDTHNIIASKLPGRVIGRQLHMQVSATLFGKRLAAIPQSQQREFYLPVSKDCLPISNTDLNLLHSISNKPYQSIRALSRELRMPFSSLRRKIHTWQKLGIICGWRYVFDNEAIGYQGALLLVSSRNAESDVYSRLLLFARKLRLVEELTEMFGKWNYALRISAESEAEFSLVKKKAESLLAGHDCDIRLIVLSKSSAIRPFPALLPEGDRKKLAVVGGLNGESD